jgi:hypothetical protein
MIETTNNMHLSWQNCLLSREAIIKVMERDAQCVPDGTPWDWEGAVHWDLADLARSPMEKALDEILAGMGV